MLTTATNPPGNRFKSCPRNQFHRPSRRPCDSFVTDRSICHSRNTIQFLDLQRTDALPRATHSRGA
jgi:hypothetical protein